MKIEQSAIYMLSGHKRNEEYTRTEKLEAWTGPPPGSNQSQDMDSLTISREISNSVSASLAEAQESYNLDDIDETLDPNLSVLKKLIELLTGRKIDLINPAQLNETPDVSAHGAEDNSETSSAETSEGWGVRYDRQTTFTESEQTGVAINGMVKTSDGKEIAFNLNIQMSRSYMEQTGLSIRLGDATRIDPLVINFNGTAAQLSDWKFEFDLNADGLNENIPFVTPGSAILVFDKNDDKQVNDGSELFGPSTGNGFTELAALDEDKNNWIDENDSAYNLLSLWQRDETGNESLVSLAQAGVGAINVGCITSPFDLKDQNNNLKGQILQTGLYLGNDGTEGSIQQLDLVI
jgi:hypothetical protein